jgi:hypothetical protein
LYIFKVLRTFLEDIRSAQNIAVIRCSKGMLWYMEELFFGLIYKRKTSRDASGKEKIQPKKIRARSFGKAN